MPSSGRHGSQLQHISALMPDAVGNVAQLPGQGCPEVPASGPPHLYQGFVDPGLLEQEDVIRAVVELFHAVPGRLKHSWVIGLYWFGKSWSHTGV